MSYRGIGIFFNSRDFIEADSWYHMTVIMTSSSPFAQFYLNGVYQPVLFLAQIGNAYPSIEYIFLGLHDMGSYQQSGYLDDFRVYSGILTAAEVAGLANRLYLPFDSLAVDSSINNIPATITASGVLVFDSPGLVGSGFLDFSGNTYNIGVPSGNCVGLVYSTSALMLSATSSNFSVAFWVYIKDTSPSPQIVLSLTSAGYVGLELFINPYNATSATIICKLIICLVFFFIFIFFLALVFYY